MYELIHCRSCKEANWWEWVIKSPCGGKITMKRYASMSFGAMRQKALKWVRERNDQLISDRRQCNIAVTRADYQQRRSQGVKNSSATMKKLRARHHEYLKSIGKVRDVET